VRSRMRQRTFRAVWGCCVGLVVVASVASGENWPQWRGPHFNGSSPEGGLPTEFSPTENLAWRADLPGVGGSTPIVWEDHVFVSAQETRGMRLWAVCLDRDSGRLRWRRAMGKGFGNKMGNTAASPSPITDGKTVWFYFGTGELVAFDFSGKELWHRNIAADHGPFEILWDYGSTGLLHRGRLYIPVIHGGPTRSGGRTSGGRAPKGGKGFVLCLDAATGKDIWKRHRPTDAVFEAQQAYTTPVPANVGGRGVILVTGADYVTAHDSSTGEEVWRSPSYNPRQDRAYRTVVSPVVADGLVVACPPRRARVFYGGLFAKAIERWTWIKAAPSPDVPTPLYYRGKLFVLVGILKRMCCLDPRTGRTIWEGSLGGTSPFQASPTGADGKVYCINMRGEVVVLSAGEKFEILHRVKLGGYGCCSTIAVAGGQLFVRTDKRLYCFGTRRR